MNPTSIAAIEAADARRVQATLAKDATALREIFADDLLYVHSSATAEDKATYIERATTGFYDYREMTLLRRAFRDYGDVVVADGDVRIHVVVKAGEKIFVTRFLQVWVLRDGHWQLASWQSTTVPGA